MGAVKVTFFSWVGKVCRPVLVVRSRGCLFTNKVGLVAVEYVGGNPVGTVDSVCSVGVTKNGDVPRKGNVGRSFILSDSDAQNGSTAET